jgi:hypothetical protein
VSNTPKVGDAYVNTRKDWLTIRRLWNECGRILRGGIDRNKVSESNWKPGSNVLLAAKVALAAGRPFFLSPTHIAGRNIYKTDTV